MSLKYCDFKKRIKDIKGLLSDQDMDVLYNCSMDSSGYRMEIGCLLGLSTACIGAGMSANDVLISLDLFDVQFLYSIDKSSDFKLLMRSADVNDDDIDFLGVWERQLKAMGFDDNIKFVPVVGNSKHSLESIEDILKSNFISMLFIDGDHSYCGVKSDFDLYYPLVEQNGLIVFHDSSYTGIKQFIGESVNANKIEVCTFKDNIAVCIKQDKQIK